MTKVERVSKQVQVELLDHLRDLHKYGPNYIADYVDTIVGPRTTRRPKVQMHPKLAALIRELALDAASMDQGLAGRLTSPFLPSSGDGRERSSRKKSSVPPLASVLSMQRDNDCLDSQEQF